MNRPLLINCQLLNKSFGAQSLFEHLSLSFYQNDRLGLIGPNGSGKTTLLKILAGKLTADKGDISTKKGTTVGYLPQEDVLDSAVSVEESLLSALEVVQLEDTEKYARVNKWLAQSGLSQPDQLVGDLSGGWRKRLAIVSALIAEPDLLLMDEPTNHLDIEGILWLEDLLKDPVFGFILVSHDRYFLENVTNRIIEINRLFPGGHLEVDGNYSEYLFRREAALNEQIELETVLANKVRRETEWLNRGPKARSTKARFRIDEAYRLKDELSNVKTRNRVSSGIRVDFEATNRKTKKLVTVKGISKEMAGLRLFSDISFVLSPGVRLGIAGNNGTGKSTLVKILSGDLEPDQGSVGFAENVKIARFEQDRSGLDLNESLKTALSPAGDSVIYRGRSIHVVSWAKRFLFRQDQLELPVGQLSGGEQARILLARFMLQPADILLLDEPTNDLDIPSLEMLEESLMDFPGAIVLVTHDRFLLDRLATNVIGLNGNGVSGIFVDSEQWIASFQNQNTAPKPKKETPRPKSRPKKLSYNDQRELDMMEEKIQTAELALEEAQQQIQSPDVMTRSEELEKWCGELERRQSLVDGLYARWEELERLKEELG